MPTFDYVCASCGTSFEVFLLPREKDVEVVCSACGSTEVTKQIAAPAVLYKGEGYYSTDNKSASSVPKDTSSGESCGGGCSCH